MCNSMGTVITETHHFYSSTRPPKEGRDNNESSEWMARAQSVGTLPGKKRVAGSRPTFSCMDWKYKLQKSYTATKSL